jgi:hypothetical protein
MNYFNKRNTCHWLLFSVVLLFLLSWLASPTGAAKKTTASPALAGIVLSSLSPELAEDLGLPREQRGAIIMGIAQGSPAEKVDLHEGDIIVQVQNSKGKTVDIEDDQKYYTVANPVPATKPLVLTILREGKRQTLQLLRSSDKLGTLNQPPPAAAPQTITLAPDGTGDCKSIAGALLRSCPGDTILFKSGKYGNIMVQRNNLTLAAFDSKNPPVLAGIYIAPVTGAKIKELIISSDSGNGVTVDSGNQITIANCQIRGFTQGVAVLINAGTGITLDANVITENWAGVYINDPASDIKISHNLINKNCGAGGISTSGSVEIINNTIIENRVSNDNFNNQLYSSKGKTVLGAGITIRGGNATIYNNIIAFNNVGCLIAPASQVTLEYNDVFQHLIDPTALHRAFEDIQIKGCNSNYLSEINYQYEMAPLLALAASDKTTITPVLKFEPSATNIYSNPFFADSQKGDYRLAADSPLTGKGRGGSYIGAFPSVDLKPVNRTNTPPAFGISARSLTDLDRQTLGLASLSGLWVTEVKKGSLAESLQIKVDDVILEVNGAVFKDNEEFKKNITTTTITTVKVFRNGTEIVLTVPMEF